MAGDLPRPLSGPPPAEVPLPNAPLVRVIAQVRFPQILAIRSPDTVAKFQEAIRATYPVLEEEQVRHVVLHPAGQPSVRDDVVWRFRDKEQGWRVSLGTGFVALETTRYHSRQDFLERLRKVLTAIENSLNPQEAVRLGIRYIDRVEVSDPNKIVQLIEPSVLGIAAIPVGRIAQHVLTEAVFPTEEGGSIQARWGHLPMQATIDPEALEPIDAASWILDLDMFTTQAQPFSAEGLIETATKFSERIYTVFRWMVTSEFLRAYGGAL